jgi:hypothetical protein
MAKTTVVVAIDQRVFIGSSYFLPVSFPVAGINSSSRG